MPQETPKEAKYIIYLAYAVFLLPFIYSAHLPMTAMFFRVFIFTLISEAMLGLYIWVVWKYPEYRPKLNFLHLLVIGYGLFLTISGILSSNPFRSFWGSQLRLYDSGFAALWHYGFFFLVLVQIIKTKKQWFNFLKFSVAASLFFGIYGIAQKLGIAPLFGPPRIDSVLWGPNMYAVFLIFQIFFSVLLFLQAYNNKAKIYYLVSGVFNFLMLLLTQTRGAALGLLCGYLFLTAIWIFQKARPDLKRIALICFVVFIVVVGVALIFRSQISIFQRFTDIKEAVSGNEPGRLMAWRTGWPAIFSNPVFGYGPENYLVAFSKFFDPSIYNQREIDNTWFDRPHNFVTEQLIFGGFIGFGLYLGIFILSFILLQKTKHPDYFTLFVPLQALLIAYLVQNAFIFEYLHTYILLVFILAFICFLAYSDKPPRFLLKNFPKWLVYFGIAFVFLMVFWNIVFGFGRAAFAERSRELARVTNNELSDFISKAENDEGLEYKKDKKVLELYKIASEFSSSKIIAADIHEDAYNVFNWENPLKRYPHNRSLDLFPVFYDWMKSDIKAEPAQARHYIQLGELIASYLFQATLSQDSLMQLSKEGESALFEAEKLSPMRQEIFYKLSKIYSRLGQEDKSEAVLKKAIDLNYKNSLSHWLLAMNYVREKKEQDALKEFRTALDLGFELRVSDQDPTEAYIILLYKYGFYEEAIKICDKIIEADNQAKWHIFKAFSLSKLGRNQEAVESAYEAINLNENSRVILTPILQTAPEFK